MYISQTTAQTIVDEIGNEVNENINFMDSLGYIIASTDSSRIGNLHEGARRIIEEGLSELYVSSDMENETTKSGINLPITIDGRVVGVIGITGELERVAPFGKIVRRITEILVEDSVLKDERRLDRRVRYRFLESWLKDDGAISNPAMIERGKRLNINIEKPRRIMIFSIEDADSMMTNMEGQRLLENVETRIRYIVSAWDDVLYLRALRRQICIMPAYKNSKLERLAKEVQDKIKNEFDVNIIVGVDGRAGGSSNVHRLCIEAERALDSTAMNHTGITFYDDLNIEIFINDISDEKKREYIAKLFNEIDETQLENYMSIIQEYMENDGSIGATADALFMHKNTLQYKLRKMSELCGHDIRVPSGAAVYFMALEFYRSLYH